MTEKTTQFDSIIIGTGQAGTPLAQTLITQGEKIAVVEKSHLGGTCVNTGCTPTKTYVASARAIWMANNAEHWGILNTGAAKANLKKIKARKDKIIEASRSGIEEMLSNSESIELIRGSAKFTSEKTIEVNGKELNANRIFINVGARPRITTGFENVKFYTNESILEIEDLPDHLIIIGGSYVGLEFAQMFRRFGSEVTIVENNSHLISKEDERTSERIAGLLKSEGINLEMNSNCIGGKPFGDGVEVQIQCDGNEKAIRGSHLLLATGRQSNADLLDLNIAGITHDEHSNISVNEKLETNVEGIFALGDCNGEGAFTHTSVDDFEIVQNHLFGDDTRKLSDRHLNYALYIDPPMGRVGLTRDQALDQDKTILYGSMEMADISRAKEKGETAGFMEVVIDENTEHIIGATVFGIGGDEIIGTFITAMYGKLSYKVLRDSVQTHPTVTELIPTMLKSLERLTPKK
jgi:pyruvate/2-oxoglutarate dehydrogenase complex dihydrolipoamide dehydrogenase (E3) component